MEAQTSGTWNGSRGGESKENKDKKLGRLPVLDQIKKLTQKVESLRKPNVLQEKNCLPNQDQKDCTIKPQEMTVKKMGLLSVANRFNNMSLTSNVKTNSAEELKDDEECEDKLLLPEDIKLQECFFNWLEGISITKMEQVVLQIDEWDKGGARVCVQVADSDVEHRIFKELVQLYLLIVKNSGNDEVGPIFGTLWNTVTINGNILQGSSVGYKYILKTMWAYSLFGQQSDYDGFIQDFDKLSKESRIAVLRIKLMTLLTFRIKRNETCVSELLSKLEPTNAKWFYYVYKYLNFCRRESSWTEDPDEKETNAISRALELEPTNPLYVVTGFENVAERLRNVSDAALADNPITWGDKSFTSVYEIVDLMKNEAKKMLEQSEGIEGYIFSLLAAIFSSRLPRRLMDFSLAEKCITKAIEVTPDCTNINHRVGLLAWKKSHDFTKAAEYFKRACEFGDKNYGARIDLMHLLLSKPEEQKDSLEEEFLKCLNDKNIWGDKEMSKLHFLKGCFLLMMKESTSEVLKSWIEAYNLEPEASHFVDCYSQARRYGWDGQLFNLNECRKVIFDIQRGTLEPKDGDAVTKISDDIQKAAQISEDRRNQWIERQRLLERPDRGNVGRTAKPGENENRNKNWKKSDKTSDRNDADN